MNAALAFAWRSLVRQPARATLGILGVAAVGALLFDMLLLSQGLVISMRDLLDRTGFDIRVTATDRFPARTATSPTPPRRREIAALPSVTRGDCRSHRRCGHSTAGPRRPARATLVGVVRRTRAAVDGSSRARRLRGDREIVVNEYAARRARRRAGRDGHRPGLLRGRRRSAPAVPFRVAGIAEFPFEAPDESGAGTTSASLADGVRHAGRANRRPRSWSRPPATPTPRPPASPRCGPTCARSPTTRRSASMEQGGFTYFRQISTVLTTVTLSFALLLITVLLTVSVNQRLGEVAALRALGFSQRRVVADVLCESALIVGIGGLLSLPLGALLAVWLDRILKRMPGIPDEPALLRVRAAGALDARRLLAATAIIAALYPMRIVARLPIAATFRDEVGGSNTSKA